MSATFPRSRVFIDGIAFWAPRLPGWDHARQAFLGRSAALEEPARRPSPSLLPATERRRAPDTVAISLEVAASACEAASLDPAATPSVFASTHGDLAISDYMCETLASNPALISPTRFHNSVHNAAAGYWTIATGCRAPYTAISAYTFTFGAGLLETIVQAITGDSAVLYVAYDISARGPMTTVVKSDGLIAAGLVVAPCRSAASRLSVSWEVATGPAAAATRAQDADLDLVQFNAMATSIPFLVALARGNGHVDLALGPDLLLKVEVGQAES